MTLAKLEHGRVLRRANSTVWFAEVQDGTRDLGVDMSAVVQEMNHEMRQSGIAYQLIPAQVELYYYAGRYNIIGGEARYVYRLLQAALQKRCASLGASAGYWAEEPAHPHVTFEYPDADVAEDVAGDDLELAGEASEVGEESSASASVASSLQDVLDWLQDVRLGRLCPLFKRHRITMSVLPTLTEEDLERVGVKALGDRKKVLKLAVSLAPS